MAWCFVRQPNGLLARWSDVVDDFTHSNLSAQDALEVCKAEHGMAEDAAERKVQGGIEDWKPWTDRVQGSGLDRWQDSLESIRRVHGDARAQEVVREIGGVEVPQVTDPASDSPSLN
jgi:hypothetical protein